jgi:hypothetical protein
LLKEKLIEIPYGFQGNQELKITRKLAFLDAEIRLAYKNEPPAFYAGRSRSFGIHRHGGQATPKARL